jgi:hypothetical protein
MGTPAPTPEGPAHDGRDAPVGGIPSVCRVFGRVYATAIGADCVVSEMTP